MPAKHPHAVFGQEQFKMLQAKNCKNSQNMIKFNYRNYQNAFIKVENYCIYYCSDN